jgi:hypothetical protein
MSNFIKQILVDSFNKTHIPLGSCYAVLHGDYVGEIFVFFKQIEKNLIFVSLPKMILREVDVVKFDIGLKDKILDSFNILPEDVYKIIESHGNNLIKS